MKKITIYQATQEKETEKAIFVAFDFYRGEDLYKYECWLPKSQITITSTSPLNIEQPKECTDYCINFEIPYWLLKKQKHKEYKSGFHTSDWSQVFAKENATRLKRLYG